jgi:hypothetical protein
MTAAFAAAGMQFSENDLVQMFLKVSLESEAGRSHRLQVDLAVTEPIAGVPALIFPLVQSAMGEVLPAAPVRVQYTACNTRLQNLRPVEVFLCNFLPIRGLS